MVVPQGEYENLYNKQYLELTTLKKKVDPAAEEKRESYLETTLKMQYPKIFEDMIQNDYVLTNSARTQEHLDSLPNNDYETKKQANLHRHKQLTEVMSGKQGKIPLLNPMRFLAQNFLTDVANEATFSPGKRRLMNRHLSKYVNQITLYLRKMMNAKSSQTGESNSQQR